MHKQTVGRLSGDITVNGAPRAASFVRCTAYVPQEDNFLPAMTVAETCGEWVAGVRRGL